MRSIVREDKKIFPPPPPQKNKEIACFEELNDLLKCCKRFLEHRSPSRKSKNIYIYRYRTYLAVSDQRSLYYFLTVNFFKSWADPDF
jgi:hypothetical protein